MADDRLPLLRGQAFAGGKYGSPRRGSQQPLPPRDPKLHAAELLRQLASIEAEVRARPNDQRNPAASREVVVVGAEPGAELKSPSLGSKADGVEVVGVDETSGLVVLDAPGISLPHLRQKIEDYGDDAKARKTRANEPAVAPVKTIARGALEQLAPELAAAPFRDEAGWFEIGCRGGRHRDRSVSASSEQQIHEELRRLGLLGPRQTLRSFMAAERVYFFVRATVDALSKLVDAVDCVFEVERVPRDVLAWLTFEGQAPADVSSFTLTPPPADAPSVVVLDSGIATAHPLLKNAVLSAASVLPGIESGEDSFGHGTKMSGIALHGDGVLDHMQRESADATHWIQSVRILEEEGKGTAVDEYSYLWPEMTREAIEGADATDSRVRNRAFVLAVTRRSAPAGPTLWSQAIDQLAFNDGKGRLICVSAGNPQESRWPTLAKDYPQGQFTEKLHDPAVAGSALTVGAFTSKVRLPPEAIYEDAKVVAREHGISIFTSTGEVVRAVKPDVVFEGGNLAISGGIHDHNVPSLVSLTTGHRWRSSGPLGMISMTSEATARAGHLAARIWCAEDKLRPETVRALIVHSASWTAAMREQFVGKADRLAACGYGAPDPDFAMSCARDRATIIVEDELANRVLQPKQVAAGKSSKRSKPRMEEHRPFKLFRLPLPSRLAEEKGNAELRVTLSYFPEPNRFRRTLFHGIDLRWDMQGPLETEAQFLDRINEAVRPKTEGRKRPKRQWESTQGFDWSIGATLRNRRTVQSDRWLGPAAFLAEPKLIAIFPVYGWWDDNRNLRFSAQRFGVVVTVVAPGIYVDIKNAVAIGAPVPVVV